VIDLVGQRFDQPFHLIFFQRLEEEADIDLVDPGLSIFVRAHFAGIVIHSARIPVTNVPRIPYHRDRMVQDELGQ
jgi:hypothetical protein